MVMLALRVGSIMVKTAVGWRRLEIYAEEAVRQQGKCCDRVYLAYSMLLCRPRFYVLPLCHHHMDKL